ncbi:hypothetical protein GA0116948_10110 [Chitinophaga costaii]|uniref:Outer membrane receptor proteins, mostly Fe transport n=1 Tax=Chitinophaga costaii TaxID=1335309 RepID=A0A1C3YP01_9BACT|nr:hypothetical protein [Chitinophaga costaii]PUZ30025.1 hypothetical protein DCM91_00655 [Chitinophaga costaii]SCB71781.1 hypothetical protein GA0116948_10110 [Chitinophaga costaii]
MLYRKGYAQGLPVIVKGEILDSAGVGVSDCYVKVYGTSSRMIYGYFNTGDKNTFEQSLTLPSPDTLNFQITHLGYAPLVVRAFVSAQLKIVTVSAVMKYQPRGLHPVEVKAPPVWKRGDTTFFKADYFKDGDERKLKDLITKVPGFEIMDDGRLLYNHREIKKIRMDGEELFGDKIKLLLNSFPVHVINTLQAIENQNDQPLLAGMGGGRNTVLNLGLKKDKLHTVFGDAEAGVGTAHRYSVSPVLFSLLQKAKVGYIGNFNSIGEGIGWEEEREFKQADETIAQNLMISNHPLQTIPGFENRWYIQNRQWDNRLQVNLPVNKKLRSETELNFLKDNQQQRSYNNAKILTGSTYFSRLDSNRITYRPSLLAVRQTFIYHPDSSRELNVSGHLFIDRTGGGQFSSYTDTTRSFVRNQLDNNWTSGSASLLYTHRISKTKAAILQVNYNKEKLGQYGQGWSPNWNQVFGVENGHFDLLSQQGSPTYQTITANWKYYNHNKGWPFDMSINYVRTSLHLANQLKLTDTANATNTLMPPGFSNAGDYTINNLHVVLEKNISLWGKKATRFKTDYGFSHATTREPDLSDRFTVPEYYFDVSQPFSFGDGYNGEINGTLYQRQLAPYQLQRAIYPSSLTSFRQWSGVNRPQRSFTMNSNFFKQWHKSEVSSTLYLYYMHNFTSIASFQTLKDFVAIQQDSLMNRGSDQLGISTSHIIPSLFLHAVINITGQYNKGANLIIGDDHQIYKNKLSSYGVTLSLKRNWHKVYFIKLSSQGLYGRNKIEGLASANIAPDICNIKSTLEQRLQVNKQLSFTYTTSYYNNNLFTPQAKSFLFMDAMVNYKFNKAPVSVAIKADNLANVKYFSSFNNYATLQNFYSVPLVRRNVFVSVRMEF